MDAVIGLRNERVCRLLATALPRGTLQLNGSSLPLTVLEPTGLVCLPLLAEVYSLSECVKISYRVHETRITCSCYPGLGASWCSFLSRRKKGSVDITECFVPLPSLVAVFLPGGRSGNLEWQVQLKLIPAATHIVRHLLLQSRLALLLEHDLPHPNGLHRHPIQSLSLWQPARHLVLFEELCGIHSAHITWLIRQRGLRDYSSVRRSRLLLL